MHDFMATFYGFLGAFIGWPLAYGLYRLTHPWRCKCGRVHWSAAKMMEHLTMKHIKSED